MTTASLTRDNVQQHLAATQAALTASIANHAAAGLAAIPVTPEWSALDFANRIAYSNRNSVCPTCSTIPRRTTAGAVTRWPFR